MPIDHEVPPFRHTIEGIAAGDGVAVCVAGQARTAAERGDESMVRPLRDAHHRVDLFLRPPRPARDRRAGAGTVARLRAASVDQNKPAPEVCDARCGIWGMGCKGLGQKRPLRDIERREPPWVLLGRPDVDGTDVDPGGAAAGAAASVTSRNGPCFRDLVGASIAQTRRPASPPTFMCKFFFGPTESTALVPGGLRSASSADLGGGPLAMARRASRRIRLDATVLHAWSCRFHSRGLGCVP